MVSVDASSGLLRVKDKDQWLDFPYETLKLETTLNPKRIDTQLNFRGGKLGELLLQAQINPLPQNKPITGNFSLTGLDLAVARPFVPMVEKLSGKLNGSGRISGGLLAPPGQRQREPGGWRGLRPGTAHQPRKLETCRR